MRLTGDPANQYNYDVPQFAHVAAAAMPFKKAQNRAEDLGLR